MHQKGNREKINQIGQEIDDQEIRDQGIRRWIELG